MVQIPEEFLDLFEKRSFANVATLLPDGHPHVVPVWVDYDGENVVLNTVEGSRKERNLRADPRVSLSIQDPDDPYRYLAIRGEVVETTTEGADDHLDSLAERYTGQPRYPRRGQDRGDRVIVRIRPDRVSAQSPPRQG